MSELVKVEETWNEEEPNKKNSLPDSTDTSSSCSPSSETIKTEEPNSPYFGGSNFYSAEFEQKVERNLTFMKSQPKKKRYLSDWSLNMENLRNYQESSGSSPEAESHQTSPGAEPVKKQRNLTKNNNDKKSCTTRDENGLKCKYCGNTYNRQSILLRHVRGVHFKKFNCPKCAKAFGCAYDVKRHLRGCKSANNLENSYTRPNVSEDINNVKSLEESYIIAKMKQDIDESNIESSLVHHEKDIIAIEAPLDLSKNPSNIWKCEICEKSYSKKEILRDHIRGIHLGQFKCERCLKSFVNNFSFDRHKKWNKCTEIMDVDQDSVVPVLVGLRKKMEFKCEYCNNTSTRAHDLKRHTMRMHLRCTDCSGTFTNRHEGEEHLKHACNKRRISGEMTNSSSEANQSTDCSRHEDSRRSSPLQPREIQKWKCFVCEEYYTNALTLQRHIDGVHFKTFSCKVCSIAFSNKAALKRHKCESETSERTAEPEQKIESGKMDNDATSSNELSIQPVFKSPSEDQSLGKEDPGEIVPAINPAVLRTLLFVQRLKILMEFQRKTSLAAHFGQTSDVEDHYDEEKDQQNQLAQVLPAQQMNPVDTEAGILDIPAINKYSCSSCSKIFTDNIALINHNKSSHINSKRHECTDCHKSFPRKDGLLRHVEAMHLQVTYQCSECPMSFKNKFYLEDHVKGIHKQCQTFDCKSCDKKFPLKSKYYRHVYSVHGKKK